MIAAEVPATWYGGTLTSAASSSSAPMKSTVLITYEREVAVAQHGRLGVAGGPAGEQQDGDVLGVERTVAAASSATTSSSARNSARGTSSTPSMAPTRAGNGVLDHDDGRCGAGEDVAELVVGQPVVHRDERQAGEAGAEQQRGHDVRVDVDEADPLDATRRAHAPARRARSSSSA